jgi:hypothetical protein
MAFEPSRGGPIWRILCGGAKGPSGLSPFDVLSSSPSYPTQSPPFLSSLALLAPSPSSPPSVPHVPPSAKPPATSTHGWRCCRVTSAHQPARATTSASPLNLCLQFSISGGSPTPPENPNLWDNNRARTPPLNTKFSTSSPATLLLAAPSHIRRGVRQRSSYLGRPSLHVGVRVLGIFGAISAG